MSFTIAATSNLGRFAIEWLAQMARTSGLSLLDWTYSEGLCRASKRSTGVVNELGEGKTGTLELFGSDIPSFFLCQGRSVYDMYNGW
ncbi:hypothetical protein F9C07_9118 [Aspergillus flavus]|uniref:Uncharacterized protein n=1 Tax=Aspergillus flavus (strain ATCC 200026 / FGSC A1120 / IAM 13836 / NRRL 3357 / JCM 12722 / SRRC 167) TaxID=332952 RepID=A0A7U2MJH4_ASPFN|nr:hypothetical protein F9C07_9118 [Aspergillus flavus]